MFEFKSSYAASSDQSESDAIRIMHVSLSEPGVALERDLAGIVCPEREAVAHRRVTLTWIE